MKTLGSMDYHGLLSDYIKLVGQYLIDHSDELAPKVPLITDFSININFPQDRGSIPEIETSAIGIPDPQKAWNIYDKHKVEPKMGE